MRRHHASLVPISQLVLPQCLLGSEAQLLAFAAALPAGLRARCLFAPLPEIFAGADGLRDAGAVPAGEVVHLRFGSVRTARVLKGAGNGAVIAESGGQAPLATSGHPFASGRVLPAAMMRVFTYAGVAAPVRIDGAALPAALLPRSCLDADLKPGRRGKAAGAGLDVASFAGFSSAAWAAGPVAGNMPDDEVPMVLLPWNLDHPGSIVPEVLMRLARLQDPLAPLVRVLVLPFNYLGQTGLIRALIEQVAEAADDTRALANVAVARLTRLASLPRLLALSRVAWVEAGDPEHVWTMARLAAAGVKPRALADGEDRLWIEAGTRYGTLAFHASVPSLRELAALLESAGQ